MGTSRTDALKECQRVNPSLNCEGFYFGDEEPVRSVSLDYDYYIDQYEVTNELYDVCVTAGVCAPPWNFDIVAGVSYFRNEKYSQYPVVNVTWDAANDYCEWRGGDYLQRQNGKKQPVEGMMLDCIPGEISLAKL